MDQILQTVVGREMGAQIVQTDNLSVQEVGGILITTIDGQSVSIQDEYSRSEQMDITPELARFYQEISSYTEAMGNKHGLTETAIEEVNNPFSR